MSPSTKESIDNGNFLNDLPGHVQNIYRSAQYIEQNYNTPDWKNNTSDPQVLTQAHDFAQEIMRVCNKFRTILNVDFSQLVGSGSGSGSPGGTGGSGSGGGGGHKP